jgi:hypothetical protein
MQLFDVLTKKVYEKEGEKKVISYKAGVMKITERGSIYLRLFHIPNIDFYIQEREPVGNIENTDNPTS